MASWLLLIVVALATFLFADSIFTPLILLLWKKIWLLALKIQALFTKKNAMQALVQSLVLAAKALFRLVNKTITNWILPLLMTRRQRYRLHFKMLGLRRSIRMRFLRGWVRWKRQDRLMRLATLIPALVLTTALFVTAGFMIAGLFGVSFVVPWLGGLPLATLLFLRRQLAALALFIFERLGFGPLVNRVVDGVIDLVWWQTPEPVQRRFDAWWGRFKIRLRRWVIGPRRKVIKRMNRFRLSRRTDNPSPVTKDGQGTADPDQEPADAQSPSPGS